MQFDIEKLFNLSVDMLCIASVDGYFKRVNPAFNRVLGWSTEELLNRPFTEFIHPDDLADTLREVEKLSHGIPTVSFENRYCCLDGSYKHLMWTAYPEQHTGLLYAVARDITRQKQDESILNLVIEASPSAMIMVDTHGKIVMANQQATQVFATPLNQLLDKTINDLIPERYRTHHPDYFHAFLDNPDVRPMGKGRDLMALRQDGTEFPIEIGLNPIHTEDGIFVLSAIVDISERKQNEEKIQNQAQALIEANQKLEQLAMNDGLTGIKNRRSFQEQLEYLISLTLRTRQPLALLLLDVDHFKQYNDSFGHVAGDFALKTLAEILQNQARGSDVVARYGGEEFAVILPNSNAKDAKTTAERFRAAIQAASWPEKAITASFGVSTIHHFPCQQQRIADLSHQLIKQADSALYQSKEDGRNRVTLYHPR